MARKTQTPHGVTTIRRRHMVRSRHHGIGGRQPELPAGRLPGPRIKEEMTRKQLSESTGIPQGHISEMENDKYRFGEKEPGNLQMLWG